MAEYIEREAAYALSKKICDAIRSREYHPATFGHLILDWIDGLPAADVAPVKHGRWKPYDLTYGRSVYYCTACEHSAVVPTVLDEPIFNYCPNCGTQMDGGVDDA